MVPDGSRPVILPSVWSAITRLISARAVSGAAAKSASASVTAFVPNRAWKHAAQPKPGLDPHGIRRPERRGPAAGVAVSQPVVGISRSPLAATSCGFEYPSRCSTRASSAAVWPLAPHSAIRSALATLAGEKNRVRGLLGQNLVQIRAERRVGRRWYVSHRPYLPAQDESMAR